MRRATHPLPYFPRCIVMQFAGLDLNALSLSAILGALFQYVPMLICGTLAPYLSASIAGILHLRSTNTDNESLVMPLVVIALCVLVIVSVNYVKSHPEKIRALLR